MNAPDREQMEMLGHFCSEAEEFYEEIQGFLGELKQGSIKKAIKKIAGPLHTLKGTSGFIAEFSELSQFIHCLEDYLLDLGNQKSPEQQGINLAVDAIEQVFIVIEQVGNGQIFDPTRIKKLTQGMNCAPTGPTAQTDANGMDSLSEKDAKKYEGYLLEQEGQVIFINPLEERIHFNNQFTTLEKMLEEYQSQLLAFDFSHIRTMGSRGWGILSAHAEDHKLVIVGMPKGNVCERTYQTFGLEDRIRSFSTREEIINL